MVLKVLGVAELQEVANNERSYYEQDFYLWLRKFLGAVSFVYLLMILLRVPAS